MLSLMLELCFKCFSFSETKRRNVLDPETFKITLWDSMTVVGVTVSMKLLGLRNICVNLYFTMGYQLQIFNFWFTFKVILKVKYVCVSMTLKVNKIMFWIFKHTCELEKKFSLFWIVIWSQRLWRWPKSQKIWLATKYGKKLDW